MALRIIGTYSSNPWKGCHTSKVRRLFAVEYGARSGRVRRDMTLIMTIHDHKLLSI